MEGVKETREKPPQFSGSGASRHKITITDHSPQAQSLADEEPQGLSSPEHLSPPPQDNSPDDNIMSSVNRPGNTYPDSSLHPEAASRPQQMPELSYTGARKVGKRRIEVVKRIETTEAVRSYTNPNSRVTLTEINPDGSTSRRFFNASPNQDNSITVSPSGEMTSPADDDILRSNDLFQPQKLYQFKRRKRSATARPSTVRQPRLADVQYDTAAHFKTPALPNRTDSNISQFDAPGGPNNMQQTQPSEPMQQVQASAPVQTVEVATFQGSTADGRPTHGIMKKTNITQEGTSGWVNSKGRPIRGYRRKEFERVEIKETTRPNYGTAQGGRPLNHAPATILTPVSSPSRTEDGLRVGEVDGYLTPVSSVKSEDSRRGQSNIPPETKGEIFLNHLAESMLTSSKDQEKVSTSINHCFQN